jgi:hypothetical protein
MSIDPGPGCSFSDNNISNKPSRASLNGRSTAQTHCPPDTAALPMRTIIIRDTGRR